VLLGGKLQPAKQKQGKKTSDLTTPDDGNEGQPRQKGTISLNAGGIKKGEARICRGQSKESRVNGWRRGGCPENLRDLKLAPNQKKCRNPMYLHG